MPKKDSSSKAKKPKTPKKQKKSKVAKPKQPRKAKAGSLAKRTIKITVLGTDAEIVRAISKKLADGNKKK